MEIQLLDDLVAKVHYVDQLLKKQLLPLFQVVRFPPVCKGEGAKKEEELEKKRRKRKKQKTWKRRRVKGEGKKDAEEDVDKEE